MLLPLRAAVIILEADNVILSEIAAALDLDQLEGDLSRVCQSVLFASWDVGRFILIEQELPFPHGHLSCAANHDPMF